MNENNLQQNDEIDLSALFKNLLRQRGLIVGFALLFTLLGGAFQFSKLAFYVPKTLNYPIAVEFSSAVKGFYPNGSTFSFRDILEPENVKDALAETKIKLDLKSLLNSLSVQHSNKLFSDTEELLLAQLGQKKLPKDQVEATQKALEALRESAKMYATLSLDFSKVKLSNHDAEKLLHSIVSHWADNALRKGLIKPNISYPEQTFTYDEKAIVIDSYDELVAYTRNLQEAVQSLSELPASDTVVFEGQSLNDVSRKLNDVFVNDVKVMQSYVYSISSILVKENELLGIRIFSQHRVKKFAKEELEKTIKSYDDVLAKLDYSSEKNISTQLSLQGEKSQTNMDSSVLTELLSLGSKVSSSDLRKDIVNKRIEAAKKLFLIEKEIEMIEGGVDTETTVNHDKVVASIPKMLKETVDEVNELQKVFAGLVSEYEKISLNKSSALYSPISDAYVGNPLELPIKKTLIVLVAATLLGLCLGGVVALMRVAFSSSGSERKAKSDFR
ncbi:MAG: hypothetical protein CSA19_00245 [Deltaproteobacteria bacterium]|nr:MAG: hypothetical protein CSA19_00245 [Deltaproteobacteria bacterium]